jgi:hypothetical protein
MNAWHTQICVEISQRRSCDREMREYGHVLIFKLEFSRKEPHCSN